MKAKVQKGSGQRRTLPSSVAVSQDAGPLGGVDSEGALSIAWCVRFRHVCRESLRHVDEVSVCCLVSFWPEVCRSS